MKLLLSVTGLHPPICFFVDHEAPVSLRAGESLSATQAQGARVRCDGGRLSVIEEGRSGSTVLEAGEATSLARDGNALVFALGDSLVAIRAACARKAPVDLRLARRHLPCRRPVHD